jgi:hypothetical protein
VKYLILIYSNAASLAAWERLSDDQRLAFGRAHKALTRDLEASGELVASEGLQDPAQAKRVVVRDGATIATDGPFAEVKEHLAGFYLVDCDSVEHAIELAARVPDAAIGGVELRPVADLSFLEP